MFFLGSAGFVAACWYALFEADGIGDIERAVLWAALVFFGLGGLLVLVELLSKPKVIEITENGFTYSVYPNQFIEWKDIEAIVPVAPPHIIGFKFKTRHHPVLYQQAAKGWFSSREPKQILQITISMFADYKQIQSAFLSAFFGEIRERVDDELEGIYRQKIDTIAEQVNMNPDDVRDYVEQLSEPGDTDSVVAALSAVAEPEPELEPELQPEAAKATTAAPLAVEGEEWWQVASKEFGDKVAGQRREKQPYGESKRRP